MEPERETPNSSGASPGGLREYKVVMLGAGGVGKSAMTMQFISHRFPDYHDPTIEDAYKTQVRIDDEPAYLDILDTAGQAEFTAMRDQYMRGGEGFIICYSITDRQSFQEAAEFKDLIYRVRHTYDIPLVLVGNKIDLKEFRQFHLVSEEEVANIQHQDQKGHLVVILIRATLTACLGVTPLAIQLRTSKENQKKIYNIIEELQVSREEGMNLAREYSCPFFETSAALHFYIDDVFHRLVREIRKREKSVPLPDRRLKSKDSLWQKLKGSLKKRKENPS